MSSPPRSGEGDFTFDELRALEQASLCLPSTVTGKRKVSAALLSPPSSGAGSVSASSTSSVSVRTRNFNTSSIDSFDIPTAYVSTEALEFIGFTPLVANEIFQNYQGRPDPNQNPDSLIDYVYGHIGILNTRHCANLTLRQSLARIGLIEQLQDSLLDPRFKTIFWTESLHYWVKDTLKINYATLYQLQQRLKNHAKGGGKKPKRASLQGVFPPEPESQLSQVTTTINMTPRDYYLPANHIALGSEGPLLPDHVALYKGKSSSEMIDTPWIEDDGSLNMNALASHIGGDFNHGQVAWYWTPEKEVAEIYRRYAAERCQYTETWLIRVQIPRSFIDPLKKEDLWYSADWKEYIWYCKKKKQPPAKFEFLWQEADIVRGHIYTGNAVPITRILAQEVQTRITSDWVLVYGDDGRKATQYAFMQRECVRLMGEVIRGKIHIEITGAIKFQQDT